MKTSLKIERAVKRAAAIAWDCLAVASVANALAYGSSIDGSQLKVLQRLLNPTRKAVTDEGRMCARVTPEAAVCCSAPPICAAC